MKRILIATDLGPGSANALARAIRLAAEDRAEIRIVHSATKTESADDSPAAHRQILTEAQIMAEELTSQSLDISVRVSAARPAEAILQAAEEFGADLIVLGSHGEPRFRDAVFGTTGSHVLRHSARPVLIVQNDHSEPYGRVLAAIDGTETAPAIFAMVRDIAPASELFAVHAFYPSLGQTLAGGSALGQHETRQERTLETLLGAFKPEGSDPQLTVRHHAIVETGEALSLVMDETEALKPDLIAMGTRAEAHFLSSHAVDTLFWSPSDLLVVPDRADVSTETAAIDA